MIYQHQKFYGKRDRKSGNRYALNFNPSRNKLYWSAPHELFKPFAGRDYKGDRKKPDGGIGPELRKEELEGFEIFEFGTAIELTAWVISK